MKRTDEAPAVLPAEDKVVVATDPAQPDEGEPSVRIVPTHVSSMAHRPSRVLVAAVPSNTSDPAFDVLPALGNRWGEVVATGDPARAAWRRYSLMVDELSLDPKRALAWTYARLLQNATWQAEDGETAIDATQLLIGEAIGDR